MRPSNMIIAVGCLFILLGFFSLWFFFLRGDGGFKRMITITGVYAVCKPSGYEVVCFLDSASDAGGLSCLPLSESGGKCQ